MLSRALRFGAIGGTTALAFAGVGRATVLTFDPVVANDGLVLQAYGDRVTSASQGGFQYGSDFGWTPNVTVEYRPNLRYRTTGYGDCTNVLYREDSGNRIMEINLLGDFGFTTCLHEFDLCAQIGEALTIKSVQVTDGSLNVLYRRDWFTLSDIVESRPLPAGQTGTPTHMHFSFDPAICQSSVLKIRVELDNLGVKAPRVGIDNIGFSQGPPVPAPAGAAVLAVGAVLAGRRRR